MMDMDMKKIGEIPEGQAGMRIYRLTGCDLIQIMLKTQIDLNVKLCEVVSHNVFIILL